MEGYISIRECLDNILNHPMLLDVKLERAVKYAVDFIKKVGCPNIFLEKTAVLDIVNYRALLPCDFSEMVQVRTAEKLYDTFRYTSDNFHMSDAKQRTFDLTYKLLGNCIFTSIKDGLIEIAYRAFAVDEDGFPLIPDNSTFSEALELYIKKKYFTVLFDMGKIQPAVLNNVQQEYAWAVGLASTDLIRLSYDLMQSLTNSLNTLVPRVNEHSRGFKDNGTMELIKKH